MKFQTLLSWTGLVTVATIGTAVHFTRIKLLNNPGIWFGLTVAIALSSCQYTDGQGNTHTIELAPLDHTISIKPNEAPQPMQPEPSTAIKAVLENPPDDGQIPLLDHPSGADIGYGLDNDEVEVLGSVPGWYNVRFPESAAEGWIHQDYVRRQP